jgi:hypothetical protein
MNLRILMLMLLLSVGCRKYEHTGYSIFQTQDLTHGDTMPDGTKVMLNYYSQVRYDKPYSHTLSLVSGEAYCVVNRGTGDPFRLTFRGITFECQNGAFNVNIYDAIRPTVFDGHTYYLEPIHLTVVKGDLTVIRNTTMFSFHAGEYYHLDDWGSLYPERDLYTNESISWMDGYYNYEMMSVTDFYYFMQSHFHTKVILGDDLPPGRYFKNVHFEPGQPLAAQFQKIAENNRLAMKYDADSNVLHIDIGH